MLDCVTTHEQPLGALGRVAPAAPPVLVTPVALAEGADHAQAEGADHAQAAEAEAEADRTLVEEADRALAEGADLIDITGLAKPAVKQLRAHLPAERLWTGEPAAFDADDPAAEDPVAAAIAAAAIGTWLGAPAIRSTHVRAVRRAIDMTRSVAGTRLPALTVRGLA